DFALGNMDAFIGAGVAYQDERKSNFIGGTAADGEVIAPATPNFTMPDYTLVDLRAGVQVDRYAVSVYATNLFDEYAFQNASTLDPTFGTAAIVRPRTIGAVLSVEF